MGCGHHIFPRPCSPALRLLRGVQRCPPGGANTPHLLCAAGPAPAREDKPRVEWSGQASWRRWKLVVRDGKGKRTNVPGLRRGAEVEGGGPTGELSQVPVGVQDVSLCSVPPALTSLIGCRGGGVLLGRPSVLTVICPCPHRMPLERGQVSLGLGPSLLSSLSGVTLGAWA